MTKKHSNLVKGHFDSEYKDYDKLIRKLIPNYDDMHKMVVDNLMFPRDSKLRILDLGIGTGETALHILEKFPNAKIDGIDISDKMMITAKNRLKEYKNQVKFLQGDITELNFDSGYDAVISVMCIHHLNPQEKKDLFKKIYNSLKKEGVFVIGDIIKFDTNKKTKERENEWKGFLKSNFSDKEARYWFANYEEEDLPDSTKNQLKWLKEAGFERARSLWEYMNYAVFLGRK